ncbi:hypothetical protein [Terribacillus saccharophilus]|uniref:hypothetical protein n=1 Tax=Terribacillus saccharophilus TaxID=361277 RepID=UPI003981B8CA
MAFLKSHNLIVYGKLLTFNTAYIQISNIVGNKDKIELQVSVYSDQDKAYLLEQLNYSFTPSLEEDSANFIKQGYEYLKTRDEYLGAADIIESE